MTDRNRWITFVNDTIVGWVAFLPAPCNGLEPLLRFATKVVDAGERHSVYRVVRLAAKHVYEPGSQSFAEYLRTQARDRGRVPLFPEDPGPGRDLWTPARVAFCRGSAVVEEEVGDLGALLRELRSDQIESCGMFMRSASPVTVLGASYPLDWSREARIIIRLDTDLWFPEVIGLMEDFPDEGTKPDFYDNRQLATRHTPRLNAFLGEIRRTTLELGGRWEKLEVDGIGFNYARMWDESGILIE